jgi:hypothetical protein
MEIERRNGKTIRAKILGYEKVEFLAHALHQMEVRVITEAQVLNAIRAPEEAGLPTQSGRHRVRGSIDQYRYVDVVYSLEKDRVLVITAISIQKAKPRPLISRRRRK